MAKKQKSRRDEAGNLGSLLREIRLSSGEGIKTAAPRLDVDYSYISKIENGLANPSPDFLTRVAALYGVDPDTLFLAAGRLPPDVDEILRERTKEAIALLRSRLGGKQ